jgi:hypothetical protein
MANLNNDELFSSITSLCREKCRLTRGQKRIKIAEACGWKIWHNTVWTDRGGEYVQGWTPEMYAKKESAVTIPDYFEDLDACHEMEKTLKFDQYKLWLVQVAMICHKDGFGTEVMSYVSATAEHRAEAFGETLKLW